MNAQTCMPSTAILQPVTLTTATVTFLRSEVTTVVEKLLHFGPVDRAASERATEERLRCFKEETVRRLMGRLPDVKDALAGRWKCYNRSRFLLGSSSSPFLIWGRRITFSFFPCFVLRSFGINARFMFSLLRLPRAFSANVLTTSVMLHARLISINPLIHKPIKSCTLDFSPF